jgi:hypothetical protein
LPRFRSSMDCTMTTGARLELGISQQPRTEYSATKAVPFLLHREFSCPPERSDSHDIRLSLVGAGRPLPRGVHRMSRSENSMNTRYIEPSQLDFQRWNRDIPEVPEIRPEAARLKDARNHARNQSIGGSNIRRSSRHHMQPLKCSSRLQGFWAQGDGCHKAMKAEIMAASVCIFHHPHRTMPGLRCL